jgi:hypothetical protein
MRAVIVSSYLNGSFRSRNGVTAMTKGGMQEPFARFEKDFPEMYEVVRAVIVVRNQRIYKIEVLKDHTAPARFKIHYSLEERLEIKPMDSKEKEFKKVWIDLTLP